MFHKHTFVDLRNNLSSLLHESFYSLFSSIKCLDMPKHGCQVNNSPSDCQCNQTIMSNTSPGSCTWGWYAFNIRLKWALTIPLTRVNGKRCNPSKTKKQKNINRLENVAGHWVCNCDKTKTINTQQIKH